MYIWHEAEGSKGSQEVASCILKFLTSLPSTIKHVLAFSDNCAGQNKNKNILKLWSYIVRFTPIETIDHKFLISGHSYMECDQDFGLIEKRKRAVGVVYMPDDWVNLVRQTSKNSMLLE